MSIGQSWVVLLVASLFEIGWILGLKQTAGFTLFWPSVLTATAMAISFFLLAVSIRKIPVGTAYACFTGIGAAGGAFLGMYLYNEPSDAMRIICILSIIGGVVGLKYYSGGHQNA